MADYQYKNIPLTPSIAAELIGETLTSQSKPIKRVDLMRYVEKIHVEAGGAPSRNTEAAVKKALSRLVDEKVLTSPSAGWYLPNRDFVKRNDSTDLAPPPDDAFQVTPELITAEETMGDGDELVYVYFTEAERKLAGYEQRDWWPCKVGFTAGNLTSRILAQGPATSMARAPIVGLVIRTDDGHGLERALHYALDQSGARIAEALGNEWFDTSPMRIKIWHEKYHGAVDTLRRK